MVYRPRAIQPVTHALAHNPPLTRRVKAVRGAIVYDSWSQKIPSDSYTTVKWSLGVKRALEAGDLEEEGAPPPKPTAKVPAQARARTPEPRLDARTETGGLQTVSASEETQGNAAWPSPLDVALAYYEACGDQPNHVINTAVRNAGYRLSSEKMDAVRREARVKANREDPNFPIERPRGPGPRR